MLKNQMFRSGTGQHQCTEIILYSTVHMICGCVLEPLFTYLQIQFAVMFMVELFASFPDDQQNREVD